MGVSEEEKRLMARAIYLKRELVRLKSQLDRELKARAGPSVPLDGHPPDPDSLPPQLREKYLHYQNSFRELAELRRNATPELKRLIDPQIAC